MRIQEHKKMALPPDQSERLKEGEHKRRNSSTSRPGSAADGGSTGAGGRRNSKRASSANPAGRRGSFDGPGRGKGDALNSAEFGQGPTMQEVIQRRLAKKTARLMRSTGAFEGKGPANFNEFNENLVYPERQVSSVLNKHLKTSEYGKTGARLTNLIQQRETEMIYSEKLARKNMKARAHLENTYVAQAVPPDMPWNKRTNCPSCNCVLTDFMKARGPFILRDEEGGPAAAFGCSYEPCLSEWNMKHSPPYLRAGELIYLGR